jgi:enediyne polyketide synthase
MAAPAEHPGSMAALTCDATTARALLGDTGAVIGNLNAPDQTVVSGPAAAIDQVIARAAEQGVRASRLRVSNAFHSPLVAPASRALATDARVPTRALGRRTLPLSCTDGQAISKDVDLRAHLAAQIIAPVDFVTLAQQLAERCDLLVEVGPGRVLTNLTERCAPTLRCLPVEGAPNGDREACLALCELFLSGQRVRWSVLHAGRFTRPFVPARARTFYRNPCERPFPVLQASDGARPARELRAASVAQPLPQALRTDQSAPAATNLEARLFEMIESRTGFPASSLHSKLRLLDDLNLDSIKAGALLADMAREAGRPSAPPGLANASLGEILAAFAAAKTDAPRARTEAPGWVADFIVSWAPEPTASATAPEALTIVGEGPLATLLASAVPGSRVLADTLAGLTVAPKNLLVLMPEGPVDLPRDVARLACLATVGERFAASNLSRVTFVQRSDGRFGQRDPQAEHTGVRSFAASFAQEHPELCVRALDVHPALAAEGAVAAVLAELGATASGAAGVDEVGVRSVPSLRRIDPFDALAKAPALRAGGTALVTGGGKGITAACALTLAEHTGCRLVLVGSSAPGPEVQQTLARMASANVQAVYRRCDVTDAQAVRQLVDTVAAELGPITAVLHGAGLNLPRQALKVGTDQALAEIGPKLWGCEHLLTALADRPPELVAALTSVIGVLGMPGNAWYAFSNERVDLALRRFASRHPATRVMAFAYSVWDEVGMGVRLGSVEGLGKRGIGAIPVEEGVSHFRRWLQHVPPDSQVVITSRMGALLQPKVATGRFAGRVVAHAPGVEHVVRLRLHPDQDTYVRDHDYRGSLLFPTVMGLEAMAQAALQCLGRDTLGDVQIEDIVLERPIVVHPVHGEEIELRASCAERAQAGEPLRVDVAIHTAATGFGSAHFKARFVLSAIDLVEPPPQVEGALDLDPQTDLYGGLLFQGPVFQRLRRVLQLNEKEVVFETEHRAQTLEAPEGFSESARAHLVAGDPYHRDTLLQAAQLVVSPDVALPVRIGRIELRRSSSGATGPCLARARFLGREGDTLFAEVTAWDASGQLIERITGYALKVLERDERLPDVHRLLEPHVRDEHELQRRLDEAAQRWQLVAPRVAFVHQRGLHQQSRQQRRALTEPLLRQAASRADAMGHLGWELSGKPVLEGSPDFGLSLAHDDAGALAVAGRGAQGCDLVGRATHSATDWRAMLGANAAVFDARAAVDGVDFAGRMLWGAQEAGMKALGTDEVALSLVATSADGAWRLVASAGSQQVDVISTLVRLARGGDRIVAAVMTTAQASIEPRPAAQHNTDSLVELYGAFGDGSSVTADGPEGQPRFRHRSMVVFREASEPSGGMRHTHFFSHMGKLRELATEPIMKDWVKDFLSGNWGAVTNRTRLVVSGEVQAGETLEGMVWSAGLSGPLGSTLELRFAWEALDATGARRLVAQGAMATTWVEVTGHGEAKLAPNPPYLQQFAERLRPPDDRVGADLLPPSLEERGTLLNRHTRRPGQPPTFRATFNTTREQSNIVGNIYFAHFTSWQGEALDAMIAKLHPEYARSRTGELRVRHVVMEHFREAMPYEQVEVQLHLTGLWERGLSISAEVFRRDGEHLVKLAAGEVDGTWYAPDAEGVWATAPLPSDLVAKLEPFGNHTEEWRHGLTARTLA